MPEPKEPKDTLAFAGSLPPDPHNGVKAILADLIEHPGLQRYAVVQFHALYDKKNVDDGTHQIVIRWDRVEPVFDDDAKAVLSLLDEAHGARLGQLPMTGPLDE